MLRVCSYNLLAQSLLRANATLYTSCPADAVHGPSRLQRLGNLLSHLNADVLALQEVEQPTFEWLSAKLAAQGMQGVYKRRTGDQLDGVALFVRATRLDVLAVEEVEFRELADHGVDCVQPAPGEDTAFGLRLQEMARKDNVALLLLANDTATGRKLVLGCTHILWNPKRGLVKLAQIRELTSRAHALCMAHGAAPILCGDFNCTPGSLAHSYLSGAPVSEQLRTETFWDGSLRQPRWYEHGSGRGIGRGGHGHSRAFGKGDGGGGGYGKGAGRGRSGDGVRAQQCGDAPSRRNPYAVLQSHAFASRLRSAYASVGEPHLTTFHGGFHGTVDYIMFDSASFVPRSHLRTPTVAELAAEGCLPSARRPSDHVPIACDLEWVGSGHAGPGACDDVARSCRYDERDGEDGHSAASGSGPNRKQMRAQSKVKRASI